MDWLLIPLACELNCAFVPDTQVCRKFRIQEKLGELLVHADVALTGVLYRKRLITVNTYHKRSKGNGNWEKETISDCYEIMSSF